MKMLNANIIKIDEYTEVIALDWFGFDQDGDITGGTMLIWGSAEIEVV